MVKTIKRFLGFVLLTVLFVACNQEAVPEAQFETLAVPAKYIISANKALPASFGATVNANGDTLSSFYPAAGFATVVTRQPGRYAKLADVVVRDIKMQRVQPIKQIALSSAEFGNPPSSGDDDAFFDLQWGHDAVNAPEAWNAGQFGQGVRVAVLDTGFDTDHPDLAPNINYALSKSFVPGEVLEYQLPDPFSHGTHTAGTVAAADNGLGTIGVAPQAELVLVKVLPDEGCGGDAAILTGIMHAAMVDADVINMSLGAVLYRSGYLELGCDPGPEDDVYVTASEVAKIVKAYSRVTTYAYQHGTTVIASAGNDANDGNKDKNKLHIPSDAAHVLSISALAPVGWAVDPANADFGQLASYSNFGSSVISFGAPGGDFVYPGNENCTVVVTRPCWVFDLVFSTGSSLNPNINFWYWSAGTSMAAPHVAGVAALIIGENGGDMAPAHVARELRARALDILKPGKDSASGYGMVQSGY